jgi:hypothetical protein
MILGDHFIKDPAGENVSCVDILMGESVDVNEMNSLEKAAGNGEQPDMSFEILTQQHTTDRLGTTLYDDIEGVSEFKSVMHERNVGVSEQRELLKFRDRLITGSRDRDKPATGRHTRQQRAALSGERAQLRSLIAQ